MKVCYENNIPVALQEEQELGLTGAAVAVTGGSYAI